MLLCQFSKWVCSYTLTGPDGEWEEEITHLNVHPIYTTDIIAYHYYNYDYSGSQGVPDYCKYTRRGFAISMIVHKSGDYCLKVDSGCGDIAESCETIVTCNSSIDYTDSPQYVYPDERDNSALGEGHENIEKAFTASSKYTNCSSEYEKHTDNNCPSGCTEDDKFYFIYVPDNIENPCAGGTVAMYDFKEEDGVDKVFPNLSKVIDFSADYEFNWTNNKNEDVTNDLHSYNYAHISQAVNPDEQICKDGTYCLYEASKLFPEFVTEKYILLSVCKEDLVDVCAVYPFADICAPDPCYNGVQDGIETGVDCGGNCPPCEDDPIEDPCVPACDDDEECVDGECLKKCDDTEPCPPGKICNDDGVCVDEEEEDPTEEECDEFCEDIDGDCIDDVCYTYVCDYYMEIIKDVNNDPPIDIEFYLTHELSANAEIEVVNEGKSQGLSFTITQDGTVLYNWGCDGVDPVSNTPTNDIFQLISSEDLKVTIEPYDYDDGNECAANAKHKIWFGLDCLTGKPEVILSSSTGSSNLLKVYPNPFQDRVHIESTESDIESIKVYNSIGTLVKKINDINALKYSLETEQLTPGIYILNIESNTENNTIKILKI